jgi:hypothetical protein
MTTTKHIAATRGRAPEWHAEAVSLIKQNFDSIHSALLSARNRAAWLGTFVRYVKFRGKEDGSIPHGQFGPWLGRHLPEISRSTIGNYMAFAESLGEKTGTQIAKNWKFAAVVNAGGLPEPVEKLLADKTAYSVFLEAKQAELKDDILVPKRGRLKGHGGASHEQRAAAQARDEAARIEALELDAESFCKWLDDSCDDKHLGLIHDAPFNALLDSLEAAIAYLRTVRTARKQKA